MVYSYVVLPRTTKAHWRPLHRIWLLGFGHPSPLYGDGGQGHCRYRHEPRGVPEVLSHDIDSRGAQRSANPAECTNHALRQIESPGTLGNVGHHQRGKYPDHPGADAIEYLGRDKQRRIGAQGEARRPQRHPALWRAFGDGAAKIRLEARFPGAAPKGYLG
jgi:hypothetical protein